jgi:hypothetical protein
MKVYVVERGLPRGGKKWQSPGYFAVVIAADGWDTSRPLRGACLKADGARIIARYDFRDSRYRGNRSSYYEARLRAENAARKENREKESSDS